MRKMRKIFGVALVAAMVLTMNLSVFAAGSKEVEGTVTKATAVDKNGKAVEVTFGNVDETLKAEVSKTETVKKVLGDKFVEGMKVVDVKEVKATGDFPLTITFEVANVNANTKVGVLHYDETAKIWESVDCKAGDKTITATFSSLSPVAFVVDENTATKAATGTAPRTGEMSMVTVAALAAVVAVAGVVTFRKKEFN